MTASTGPQEPRYGVSLILAAYAAYYQDRPPRDDTQWGVSHVMDDSGALRLVPLTLANLDEWAARVWANPRDHDGAWTMAPR